jgi:hypothetical protein
VWKILKKVWKILKKVWKILKRVWKICKKVWKNLEKSVKNGFKILQGPFTGPYNVLAKTLFNDQNWSPLTEGHTVSNCPRIRQCGV